MKIWDLRTLQCVQTINDTQDALGGRSSGVTFAHFEVCPPRRQIVTAAHHLHVYRQVCMVVCCFCAVCAVSAFRLLTAALPPLLQVTDAALKTQTESTPITAAMFNSDVSVLYIF